MSILMSARTQSATRLVSTPRAPTSVIVSRGSLSQATHSHVTQMCRVWRLDVTLSPRFVPRLVPMRCAFVELDLFPMKSTRFPVWIWTNARVPFVTRNAPIRLEGISAGVKMDILFSQMAEHVWT